MWRPGAARPFAGRSDVRCNSRSAASSPSHRCRPPRPCPGIRSPWRPAGSAGFHPPRAGHTSPWRSGRPIALRPPCSLRRPFGAARLPSCPPSEFYRGKRPLGGWLSRPDRWRPVRPTAPTRASVSPQPWQSGRLRRRVSPGPCRPACPRPFPPASRGAWQAPPRRDRAALPLMRSPETPASTSPRGVSCCSLHSRLRAPLPIRAISH